MHKRLASICLALIATGISLYAAPKKKAPPTPVWTSVDAKDLPEDFQYQGEYVGDETGCQVIALGKGAFQAVVYPGGLPGAGWDGENKCIMHGELKEGTVTFTPATGPRHYLAGPAEQFSASRRFPPQGHIPCRGTLKDGVLALTVDAADTQSLKKTVRKSETLGMAPPEGALVLFDGTGTDAFKGGRLDETTRLLNTDGRDITTKQTFRSYRLHIEFMLPYRPEARGQKRGNSGVYHGNLYETQVLDSFGLEGFENECGGIYKTARPIVNMCFPPLTWQTYDAELTSAVVEDGKKSRNARLTLRHNGVLIHDDVELPKPTGGAAKIPEGAPGGIRFQGHGNPLQYRNIWIVER